ncbi:hypothetical protein CTEN210_10349 [Chaetoceros tenuissimus]|uniref:LNR domain-containing protein n=1 Tax=Chaetoceros tenuissimus TaxID=426638 RepID=A0AAD3CX92_9STRA|nr:hypothetical protein CTEN210_10349 [Chaetoceros tenuissimus]
MPKKEDEKIRHDTSRVAVAPEECSDNDVECAEESVVASRVVPREEEAVANPAGVSPAYISPAYIDLSKDIEEKDHEASPQARRKRIKYCLVISFAVVFGIIGATIGIIITSKKPVCEKENKEEELGNGVCNSDYNTKNCEWDGGDCDEWNKKAEKYPDCFAYPYRGWGDGSCDYRYNTESCGWDLGDCDLYNSLIHCDVPYPEYIGDGICHIGRGYNTEACGFDGGDCKEFYEKYPNCTYGEDFYFAETVGDGICDTNFLNPFLPSCSKLLNF